MAEQLLLIRHGQTEWSRDGKHTSRTDLSLTESGRADGHRLHDLLHDIQPVRLLTSPLRRALETAELVYPGFAIEKRDALREWDYGDYEGITTPEIRSENPGWSLWRDGCPNGESPEQIGARVDQLLVELREVSGTIALVAHGHVLRVLAARYLGLPVESGKSFELHTGTISQLGWERETPTIELWNCPR